MGSVRRRGPSWLLDYYDTRGGRHRETIRAASRQEAERILKQREGDSAAGRPSAFHAEKVTFNELANTLLTDYHINQRRSLGRARISVAHLMGFFDGWKATAISSDSVRSYIEKRLKTASNGTINRELAGLKRAFKLAVQAGTLLRVPHIPFLQEAPPRRGFFEPEQFQAVLRHLPVWIHPVALFGYELGWRLREILRLQRHQINLEEGWVRLDPGTTKNKEGRLAYLSPGLLEVLRRQHEATRALERQQERIIASVFHKGGKPIGSFYKTWRTACRKAGVPGMLFHDLRRTAVRNMVRAGIPERVAMQISGHKTRSVFERYNIVSEGDLREAARKLGTANRVGGAVAH